MYKKLFLYKVISDFALIDCYLLNGLMKFIVKCMLSSSQSLNVVILSKLTFFPFIDTHERVPPDVV